MALARQEPRRPIDHSLDAAVFGREVVRPPRRAIGARERASHARLLVDDVLCADDALLRVAALVHHAVRLRAVVRGGELVRDVALRVELAVDGPQDADDLGARFFFAAEVVEGHFDGGGGLAVAGWL